METGVFSWQELLSSRRERRPLIAGIVNATTDSFSDGRSSFDPCERINFALQLLAEGADILDLGGESTRPGAEEVPPAVEWARIAPVLEGVLQERPETVISIDTRHSFTAEKALQKGAKIINDVSGGRFDPAILEVVADYGAGCILTHSSGTPDVMQESNTVITGNTLQIVKTALQDILSTAYQHKISRSQIMLDVGIGFGKTRCGNYELLRNADLLEKEFALPFCWGVSRKSLLKSEPDTMQKRIAGSLALALKLAEKEVSLLRVHDAALTLSALKAALEMDDIR